MTTADVNQEQCLQRLRGLAPDLAFSVNVYQRLHAPVLAIPRLGVVNVHFGMLPFYRGMSPYMWALSRGEAEIGITAHFMDERFDTGDIIAQRIVRVRSQDSACAVYLRGCLVARDILLEIARSADEGTIPRRVQPRDGGTYYSLPDKKCIADIRRRGFALANPQDLARMAYARIGGRCLP